GRRVPAPPFDSSRPGHRGGKVRRDRHVYRHRQLRRRTQAARPRVSFRQGVGFHGTTGGKAATPRDNTRSASHREPKTRAAPAGGPEGSRVIAPAESLEPVRGFRRHPYGSVDALRRDEPRQTLDTCPSTAGMSDKAATTTHSLTPIASRVRMRLSAG